MVISNNEGNIEKIKNRQKEDLPPATLEAQRKKRQKDIRNDDGYFNLNIGGIRNAKMIFIRTEKIIII